MGIGSSIARFGFGGALLTSALSFMATPEGTERTFNPLQSLKDYLGEDSFFSKLLSSGAGAGIAAFAGALAMPKAFGGVRGAAMSLAGLYTAWGMYKGTVSGYFNGLPGQVADLSKNLGVEFGGSGSNKPTTSGFVNDAFRNSIKLTSLAADPMQGSGAQAIKVLADAEEAARVHGASAKTTAELLAPLKRPLSRDQMNGIIQKVDMHPQDIQDEIGVVTQNDKGEQSVPQRPEVFAIEAETLENDEIA